MQLEQININKIKVIPAIDSEDKDVAEVIFSRCHVLGNKKPIGKRIIYLVLYEEMAIGALLFDAPVDTNKLRKQAIGWNQTQEKERKKHIANNSRFAIIDKCKGIKNLASKSLSLVCDRISKDWYEEYGVALLAVETYVDPNHNNNTGSCYKANGWNYLGMSSGYRKKDNTFTHSKLYFLKPLHQDSYAALSCDIPHALITGVKPVSGESNNNYVLPADLIKLSELEVLFRTIKDPRSPKKLIFKLSVTLSLSLTASMSGYTQYRQIADWIKNIPLQERKRFGLSKNRTPEESTIRKIITSIDPEEISVILNKWQFEKFKISEKPDIISLDGKANRGTSNSLSKQQGFLNAYANNLGICIDSVPCNKGAGEKAVGLETVNKLECKIAKDSVYVTDAMQTGDQLGELVVKKKVI